MTVVDNQKYVDVDVELCYCGEDLCNQERSQAMARYGPQAMSQIMTIFAVLSTFIDWKRL